MVSRRQTLIGIGALVGGSGVIAGTGAFSSVEAERTVEVSTTGDSSAALGLSGNDSSIVGTETVNGNSVLTIENSQINENSKTEFDNAFSASNNGSDNVDFYVDASGVEVQDNSGNTVVILDFIVNGSSIVGSGNSVSISSGSSVDVGLTIDIRADGVTGSDLDNLESVTFVAESSA